jgi:FkbM family methyltransferase
MGGKVVGPQRTGWLKQAGIYAWQNRWLTLFGRAALHTPILGQALQGVKRRVFPPGERVWVRVDSGIAQGLWLQTDPYREQEYLRGNVEPEVQEAIRTYLKPGDCFFDVGAHVGLYSLIASRVVGIDGCVVAFEPDPRNVQLLREHVIRNGLSNVSIEEAAVWRSDGEVLFLRGGSTPMGKSSRRGAVIEPGAAPESGDTISIQAVSLDRYAADGYSPSLVKVDVEGAECEVLKGAEKLLAKVKPALICEVHHEAAATFMAKFLPAKDYVLRWTPQRYQFPFPRYLVAVPSQS